jgi:hypothetical protein
MPVTCDHHYLRTGHQLEGAVDRSVFPILLPFQSTINATTETDPAPIADEVFP